MVEEWHVPTVQVPDVGVTALVIGAAERWGDRVAFRFTDGELTFADLLAEASRFAYGLAAYGVGSGDVVAVRLGNGPSFPIAYYGTLLAGATFVPFDPRLGPRELVSLLADADAKLLVVAGEQDLDGSVGSDRTVLVADLLADRPDAPPEVAVRPASDLAQIAYTGGTTGTPKGVMITHRAAVASALQYACAATGAVPVTDDRGGLRIDQPDASYAMRVGQEIAVSATPWFHAMGMLAHLNVPMLTGMTQVIPGQFSVPGFLEDMETWSATLVGGAPALFAALVAHRSFETRELSSVRIVFSAAAPMPPTLSRTLSARWPKAMLCEIYGMTEASGMTSTSWRWSAVRKPGSVGFPVPSTELKIVPPEAERVDDGLPGSPRDTVGEVCVRGPQVMAGYLGHPEETAAVLSADGWLRTGDIGTIDADGQLSVVDRQKDTVLFMGYSVYPRELEDVLLGHPDVVAAAVVGMPDARVGELPTAFVVRSPRVDSENGGDHAAERELRDYANARLARHKHVRKLVFVDEIPMSATGKVLRRELRHRLQPPSSGSGTSVPPG